MFHGLYEQVVRFASEAPLAAEVIQARAEYVHRTGELFESDPAYERRIAAFLEWYALDRPIASAGGKRPVDLYVEKLEADRKQVAGEGTDEELGRVRGLASSRPSLFEFKRAKDEHLILT